MKKDELPAYLTDVAARFVPVARDVIVRNRHMNRVGLAVAITDPEVQAVIREFLAVVTTHLSRTTKETPYTKLELLEYLTERAKEFAPVARDGISPDPQERQSVSATQDEVEAVLVAYVNTIGVEQSVDYALSTSDL
jgi:hypothetical protein